MFGQRVLSKKNIIIITIIAAALVLGIFCITTTVKASTKSNRDIKVKSIIIEEGDTLWDIATENYTKEYDSINTYIKAIKECNQLTSDTIHTGMYLIVPYYQN